MSETVENAKIVMPQVRRVPMVTQQFVESLDLFEGALPQFAQTPQLTPLAFCDIKAPALAVLQVLLRPTFVPILELAALAVQFAERVLPLYDAPELRGLMSAALRWRRAAYTTANHTLPDMGGSAESVRLERSARTELDELRRGVDASLAQTTAAQRYVVRACLYATTPPGDGAHEEEWAISAAMAAASACRAAAREKSAAQGQSDARAVVDGVEAYSEELRAQRALLRAALVRLDDNSKEVGP